MITDRKETVGRERGICVSKGNRISGKSEFMKYRDSWKDKWMNGQMDRQLNLYALIYVLLRVGILSIWLEISLDLLLLLFSGEKTLLMCDE